MAEYALDDGEYYSEDELLRIDNHARRELGIPLRRKEVVQPYLVEAGEPEDGEVSPRAHLCPVGQVPCVKGEALGGDVSPADLPDRFGQCLYRATYADAERACGGVEALRHPPERLRPAAPYPGRLFLPEPQFLEECRGSVEL